MRSYTRRAHYPLVRSEKLSRHVLFFAAVESSLSNQASNEVAKADLTSTEANIDRNRQIDPQSSIPNLRSGKAHRISVAASPWYMGSK